MTVQRYVYDILQRHTLPLLKRLPGATFSTRQCSASHGKGVIRLSPHVPSRHVGAFNNRRAASPFVRLVEVEKRWEASNYPHGVLPLNWDEIELNRSVTCKFLKATANDRRHIAHCHDELRGPLIWPLPIRDVCMLEAGPSPAEVARSLQWLESSNPDVKSMPNTHKWYCHQEDQPMSPQSINICIGLLLLDFKC
ncbi:uncharacterized protein TNCV_4900231 [Trichonephila clavipes]|nr:uncharacterized protein TNCV_4900231 [Trichonephila clavipes]